MTSVGLVHDYLLVMRGAERTFLEIAQLWPAANVHTLLYDERATGGAFAAHRVRPSPLQKLPLHQGNFRLALPLLPLATERLPVRDYDLVVSSSSAFAHGVRPGPDSVHVCYCHSLFRYAWFERERALSELPAPLRPLLAATLRRLRAWDREASRRVTAYIANSKITQERLSEYYGRDSELLHPPVHLERFRRGRPEDWFLFVGEITRHKRAEEAVRAARRAGRRIKLVGAGPDLARLRALYAGPDVELLGRVDDDTLADLYSRCLALVVPNVEEFGIAAVEAQAAGRPVLSVSAGGALETIVHGTSGILVPPGRPDALAEALRDEDFTRFDPESVASCAQQFSAASFRERLAAIVAGCQRNG